MIPARFAGDRMRRFVEGTGAQNQDEPPEREDREAEGADAASRGSQGANARHSGSADIADRSRFPLDGDERARLRCCRLQCSVAVDTANHLIITHEVTNVGTDRSQLSAVAKLAKATLEVENLDAVADRGYFSR